MLTLTGSRTSHCVPQHTHVTTHCPIIRRGIIDTSLHVLRSTGNDYGRYITSLSSKRRLGPVQSSLPIALPLSPLDASGTWSDTPAMPFPLSLPGPLMLPNYFPLAHSLPISPFIERSR